MLSRPNSFISVCQFERNPELMKLNNCNKFKRSFTNRGLGFTFNNDKAPELYKNNKNIDLQLDSLFFNKEHQPKLTSASPDDALKVMIENNFEEIAAYENTRSSSNPAGDMKLKPVELVVVLHDPSHPANIRTKSIKIPLGQSSTVYITPSVIETDHTGQLLGQTQRECRLKEENNNIQIFREVLTNISCFFVNKFILIFNILTINLVQNLLREYSREACVLECQIEQAFQRCRCFPWDYPFKSEDDEFLICDIYRNICFENVMKNNSKESCGDVKKCPMDCTSISYTYSRKRKEKELCSKKGTDLIFEEFYNNPFPPRFITRARMFFFNESSKASDQCAKEWFHEIRQSNQ